MSKIEHRKRIAAALLVGFALTTAACGDDSSDATPTATTTTPAAGSAATMAPSADSSMGDTAMGDTAMGDTFGAGCAAIPTAGAGSMEGMAQDPVATAASNNPLLSTLVTAVTAAGLGDTLNTTDDLTVFAPTNDAFKALDATTMSAAMADPTGLLSTVLTYHVVAGRLSPAELAGDHETLEGETLTIEGSGDSFTVNDGPNVICGNVQTANATVYIIDGVLLPPSAMG